MIAYLAGKIVAKKEGLAIVAVNGVGYEVILPAKIADNLPAMGKDLVLFCNLESNERGMKLYGFNTFEQLEFFKVIRGIQGVGPRAALEIAGLGQPQDIQDKIKKGDLSFLNGIAGIGQKKAAKIILELSGQITTGASKKSKTALAEDEASLALINLGFPRGRAQEVLAQLPKGLDTQTKITQALQILGK